jgi:hypothetical protein
VSGPSTIPDRIRAAAAYRGLSMRQLADELAAAFPDLRGLSHGRLLQLGERSLPQPWQVDAIAEVCGVPGWFISEGFPAIPSPRPAPERDLAAELDAAVARIAALERVAATAES